MKKQFHQTSKSFPILLLGVCCFLLWSLNSQAYHVSAYQDNEATPSPTLEFPATPSLEESQATFTNTVEKTFTAESTTTVADAPSLTVTLPFKNPPFLPGEYALDEILVRFTDAATNEGIQQCLLSANGVILTSIEELGIWTVQIPFGKVAESIEIISSCQHIRYVEPNYMAFIADTIPSDPNLNLQYGLVNIRAPQGWDFSTGSTAVTIAIIDSGVDLGHADLTGKIVPGFDFVNSDSIAQDDNGHGTHVAGIAAASGNNGIGVAGVSWGARIMPIKVLDAGGGGSFANVAAGIIWAADNGAQVINLSLGGASSSTVLQDAVNYAYGKGVVLIAAAGNTGSNFVLYPARYANVIAVGAVDTTNNHAGFSNYGPELDLVAPGASIYSTVIGGYGYNSGTSMAAPYVSGLAAILRGYPGGYSPAGITLKLESTTLDLGFPGLDNLYGYGLIQMDTAIQSVYITLTPVPIPTFPPDLAGNQPLISMNNSVATLIPSSTPSPTTSISSSDTETSLVTTSPTNNVSEGQETAISEVNALSTHHTQQEGWFSTFALPCLAVILISLGIGLFFIARHQQKHGHMNY